MAVKMNHYLALLGHDVSQREDRFDKLVVWLWCTGSVDTIEKVILFLNKTNPMFKREVMLLLRRHISTHTNQLT